jgi:two-component system, OmpR family, alkaline phosphatase synthesis response regulator PhoP
MPNILIVDDDPIIRNLLLQIILEPFEEKGVELMTAENGEIALEKIRDERPKIVLLDVMMPKMNGFEVCDIVKKDPKLKDTYVIILTAKGQDTDRQRARDIGVDFYVTKPFNPDDLVRKVTEILGIAV